MPFFGASGLRISELTSLRVKHFEPDHGKRIGLLRVKGRNKKHRALFVVDNLYDELADYLACELSPKKKNASFFPIDAGTAISKNRVLKMIKERCRAAGIEHRVTPTCAAAWFCHIDVSCRRSALCRPDTMMGHSHKAETAIYVHVSDKLQKQALRANQPARRLDMAVNQQLFFEHIDAFFNYRQDIYKVSEQTSKSNQVDLDLFRSFIQANGHEAISGPAVMQFQYYLKNDRNNSGGSINRKLCTLRSYSHFLALMDVPGARSLPFDDVLKIRQGYRNRPNALTVDQMRLLFESICRETVLGIRDYAVYALMYQTRLRGAPS